jgi:cyclophilin family peptidyl-prolyl cis-trans isomerase
MRSDAVKGRYAILLAAAALAAAGCRKPEQRQPAAAAPAAPAATQPGANDSLPVVVLQTSLGRIAMQLDRAKAPRTVGNFLDHVNAHFYDGLVFHRVIPGFMIQAGILTASGMERTSSAPPVPNEADNGLKNVRGAVALARTADPQSGGVQFFINLVDNPALDFKARTPEGWGYAVFGHVIQGMDVVDKIAHVPTTTSGGYQNIPVKPVVITKMYVDTGGVRSGK